MGQHTQREHNYVKRFGGWRVCSASFQLCGSFVSSFVVFDVFAVRASLMLCLNASGKSDAMICFLCTTAAMAVAVMMAKQHGKHLLVVAKVFVDNEILKSVLIRTPIIDDIQSLSVSFFCRLACTLFHFAVLVFYIALYNGRFFALVLLLLFSILYFFLHSHVHSLASAILF